MSDSPSYHPFAKGDKSLSDNPSNACQCHSEPFDKLGGFRIDSAKDLEILRLTPQNDVVEEPAPRRGVLLFSISRKEPSQQGESDFTICKKIDLTTF